MCLVPLWGPQPEDPGCRLWWVVDGWVVDGTASMRKTPLLLGHGGKGMGAVDIHGPAGRWHFWPTHRAAVLEDAEIV